MKKSSHTNDSYGIIPAIAFEVGESDITYLLFTPRIEDGIGKYSDAKPYENAWEKIFS